MDAESQRVLPAMERSVLHSFLFLIGAFFLLLLIPACSSREDAAKKSSTVDKADSTFVESAKIKGVTISVGDASDTVYAQIGRGFRTVATNDPADQSSIIIFSSYVSEDKTYRISFCKAEKGYFHVCKISAMETSQKLGAEHPSDAERDLGANLSKQRDGNNNNKTRPPIYTNDDLRKRDIPKN